jgi:hypothetical protein
VAEKLTRREITACLVQAGAQLIVCLLQAGLSDEAEDFVDWTNDNLDIDLSSSLPAELEEQEYD